MQLHCTKCSRSIALTDAVQLTDRGLSHVECKRPSVLTSEERQLVFVYCSDHDVAHCSSCNLSFRFPQLGSDMLGGRTNQCTGCRQDLTETIRAHLYSCAMLPVEVRRRAQEVREAAKRLVKESQQARDRADVLLRQLEAALLSRQQALTAAMARRMNPKPDTSI